MAQEALVALGDHWALEDQPFYLQNTRTGVTWGCGVGLELQEMGVGDGSLQDIAPLELLWRLHPSLVICWEH